MVRTHPEKKKGAENDWHDGEDKVRQKNGYGEDEARQKKISMMVSTQDEKNAYWT